MFRSRRLLEMKDPREPARTKEAGERQERGVQTECNPRGLSPRLSEVNLFTLLSLWMELFPNDKQKPTQRRNGLVVVHSSKIIGLHCSSMDLHVGQIAVIKHGSRLKECDLYFSRKPCSTCLKMVLNAGVSRISYWPGDPEISLAENKVMNSCYSDAKLDAKAVERLKSNSRARVCTLLQPLAYNMLQYIEETSRKCEFFQSMNAKDSDFKHRDSFTECRRNRLREFEKLFLIADSNTHKEILKTVGLENVCDDVHFINLRHKMEELVYLLATIDCSVPMSGIFISDDSASEEHTNNDFQNFARHCMVQARLLAYRTEDQKIGVGAVIWAEGKSSNCDATGARYLIGCGYNAYPTGSEYADFPQMDEKQQKDREARKFRYIVHAEQNALTFRCQDIKEDEKTMIFVTKCPCDECIPLINSAGIKQIYTGDLDAGKVKADISYQKFSGLQGVKKFTWQKNPAHSILESGVQTVHMKSEPTKPPIFESSVASKIVNACTMRSSCEPELHCKPSVQGHSPSIEDPHSPLAKGDLKRPLIAVQPEPQIDELLNLELSEPAFKRRVVEHQCYLQSLVTSLATVMNDVVCGMEKIKSGLNTSMSDVHSVLDHHLSALQSSRESVSSQTASTQGLSCIGAALQTALSAALSDMSSKVQEGLQIGFESLGEKVQSAIRTGFADLVKEHASAHQCLCRSQGGEIPFNRGVNSPSQEEGILNSGLSLSSSHPSQLSSGSLLESSSPSMVMLAPGGRNLEKLQ
ncbi:cytidine and dCMP deaminase domain-containing protein 1 isoform X2 [Mobula birostris]|uniref:cytidine and dCMP deaminase domain-containing protein 1 isoform X2 n=1 Tax=Mobula birostris TaxID=1983395 RepID=UPI003B285BB8